MILQSLLEYYETLVKEEKVPRLGWCFAKVSYAISLNIDGDIKGVICQKTEELTMNNKSVIVPKRMIVPEQEHRTSGILPFFLCDTPKYILGIDKKDDEKSKIECTKRFEASKKLHLDLLENIDCDIAKAICNFYKKWNPETARENKFIDEYFDEITEGGNLIFCIITRNAQDNDQIKEVWDKYLSEKDDGVDGICSITGKHGKIARLHKAIKGVKGAQSSGASLVSFNAPAFESHWKEQGFNAPVSREVEFAYTTTLNYLLSKREHTMQIGDMTLVFWNETDQDEYQDLFKFSIEPSNDNKFDLVKIFKSIKEQKDIDINGIKINPKQKFYILWLAPNAGRISVQKFYESSLENILSNSAEHQKRLKIVGCKSIKGEGLKTWELINATVNKKLKDSFKKNTYTSGSLYDTILLGNDYPEKLYTDILERIKAECGEISCIRAAIIKAFLMKNRNWEGENFMSLNEECKDMPYLLGRLFSVLESIQLTSMGKEYDSSGVRTIKDRFFNSACTTPSFIFPRLLTLSNNHMSKLNRDKKGKYIYYSKILMSIIEDIDGNDGFPLELSLEDRGKFILGYYHQTQKKYESKKENNEVKKEEV